MSTLTESYNSVGYQSLPDFHLEAAPWFRRNGSEILQHLWQPFKRHGQWDKYGLVLVHTHFHLSGDEILVETPNPDGNGSVALPWKIEGKTVYPPSNWEEFAISAKLYIVPTSWYFSPDGDLSPYEFETSDRVEDNPAQDFVENLFQRLKSLQLEKFVGLAKLQEQDDNQQYYEVTLANLRANVMKKVNAAKGHLPREKSLKTLWRFTQNGKLVGNNACPDCGVSGS